MKKIKQTEKINRVEPQPTKALEQYIARMSEEERLDFAKHFYIIRKCERGEGDLQQYVDEMGVEGWIDFLDHLEVMLGIQKSIMEKS